MLRFPPLLCGWLFGDFSLNLYYFWFCCFGTMVFCCLDCAALAPYLLLAFVFLTCLGPMYEITWCRVVLWAIVSFFSWAFWWIYNVVFVEAFRACFFLLCWFCHFGGSVVSVFLFSLCSGIDVCCALGAALFDASTNLFFLNFVLRNPRFYSPSCAGAGFSLRRICHFRAPFSFVALLFFGAWGWWA